MDDARAKWKKAFEIAEKICRESGDFVKGNAMGSFQKSYPCMDYIKRLLDILMYEIGCGSEDRTLAVAILRVLLRETNCACFQIEEQFGKDITEMSHFLLRKEDEDFFGYLMRCMRSKYSEVFRTVVLADILLWERIMDE